MVDGGRSRPHTLTVVDPDLAVGQLPRLVAENLWVVAQAVQGMCSQTTQLEVCGTVPSVASHPAPAFETYRAVTGRLCSGDPGPVGLERRLRPWSAGCLDLLTSLVSKT